jgi:transcription elongation factor Elf1
MDHSISQKGTKTRAREATHGPALASSQQCPKCESQHVLRTQSENGKRMGDFMCARCSTFFS